MSRPTPRTPDNIFVSLLHFMDGQGLSVSLRVLLLPILLIMLAIGGSAWLVHQQMEEVAHLQVKAIGNTLADQITSMASVPMHDNDLISLQATLDTLKGNPLVRHAAIHSIDKRLLAEVGTPVRRGLHDSQIDEFTRPITLMDVAKGQLYLTIDAESFRAPITGSLQNLAILGLILLLITWILGRRLGNQLTSPLLQLQDWVREPDEQAPACERRDEIGELARQLQHRLAIQPPEDEHDEEPNFGDDDVPLHIDEDLLRELAISDLDEKKPAANPSVWGRAAAPQEERSEPEIGEQPAAAKPRPQRTQLEEDFNIDLDSLVIDFDAPPPVSAPPRRLRPVVAQTQPLDDLGLPADFLDSLQLQVPPRPLAPQPPASGPVAFSNPPRLMSAILAIQLGNQEELRQLPHQRLLALLQRYRKGLEETARMYHGSLYRLDDGGSLILFHSNQSGDHYLQRALCCGEQLRTLGQLLQGEIADSGLPLLLQLALNQGEGLYGQPLGTLLRRDSCLTVMELRQRSCSQLLLEDNLGRDAAVASFARLRDLPAPVSARCIERLAEPWPERIREQISRLLQD